MTPDKDAPSTAQLVAETREQALNLGFSGMVVANTDLTRAADRLRRWLAAGYHGEMHYMTAHGDKRYRPERLVPGTVSCLSLAMNYLPEPSSRMREALQHGERAYVSRYALGRDYHKVLRRRLQKLAGWIEERVGPFGYRVFTDSAPVMEKPLAANGGLGWIGKHSNLIDRHRGSWFFLGEIYTDLALPADPPVDDHCGSCRRCIDACPTGAIVEPYVVDARRCISYLTIENRGAIPAELRPLFGNRVFGCDDCQLVCPWNRDARTTAIADFAPRHGLDSALLVDLFAWDEATWARRTEGSPIRRAGYPGWLRNLAVALGNAPPSDTAVAALEGRAADPSPLVREHVAWALGRQRRRRTPDAPTQPQRSSSA